MLTSLKVKDYMSSNKTTFTKDMDVLRAIHILMEQDLSGAPVMDHHGNLVGFLSEKDCMRVALNSAYHGEVGGKVEAYMTQGLVSVDVDTPIVDVAQQFLDASYKTLAVVKDNRIVGAINRRHILKALEYTAAPESTKKPSSQQSTKQSVHLPDAH